MPDNLMEVKVQLIKVNDQGSNSHGQILPTSSVKENLQDILTAEWSKSTSGGYE